MRPHVAIQAIVFFSILGLLYRYYGHHSHLSAVTEGAYPVTEIAIPQTVHQLLLSMPDHPVSQFEPSDHVISWQQSGWKVEYWSEEACLELAREVDASGTFAAAFEQLPYAVLKSDFCRYLVLFGRGGVYSDLDVHLVRPLPWTVMGSEDEHHSPPNVIIGLEGDATTKGLPRSPQFVQWTMASNALHPMFRDLLTRIAERTSSFVKQVHALEGDAEVNVMDWTGPSVWTDTILDYLGCSEEQIQNLRDLKDPVRIRDVMILPKRSFAVTQGEDHTSPDVLVKHYFSGTWKGCKNRWHGRILPWLSYNMLTVHHLQRSQSERIVWLCEELSIPYELKTYQRDAKTLLAPPELQQLPVIQDGSTTLAESGAIAEYILTKYGNGKLVIPPTADNYADYLYFLHFANGYFQPALVGYSTVLRSGISRDDPSARFARRNFEQALRVLDDRLTKNTWLAGEEFTAADVMNGFTLTTARLFFPYSLAGYEGILAYLHRVSQREAYKAAMAKGDPGLVPLISAEKPRPIRL
ncbi:putative alpha-1,6-mannosyltransferase subunit [Aspergillus novofumigatus IBT 16806]|uniref:Putative alpha-1,6-mannosyltransferase subunit n=1 Tax=Aspergillus novofumigatus (strain IBT 16806) TaxID=1392255 RepID=A0A2I1BWT9_ASPN1|nr:putative alpha-1,6-mannosyltransferase subunit [Aspergillus novofumigatus IBT 16806]PKX89845.1 putative alpha-1,6-mannosyltransferase subunit [Aspergillus novofumigatus IBT 16806]